ncbi:MAG: PaaI family thioesterase [Bacillota bacterium]
MGVAKFIANLKFLSEARRLELYPAFAMMRVKVLEIGDGWRRVRMKLPLNSISRNPGGVMFGGFQASLADPVAALACARVFPGYSVWTRAMTVDFQKGGSTDLELRFEMKPEQEAAIAAELMTKGRSTPTFEYGYYLTDGTLCTRISNTVAIRPKGYKKATTPPADMDAL